VVRRYVAEGAKVGVIDLLRDRLEALAEQFGDDVITVQGDVRQLHDNEEAVARTVEAFGKLDIFVANAGITDAFRDFVDLGGHTIEAAYEEIFDVNVKGCLLGAWAALPELAATGGCMILTLSPSSFYPDGGGVLYAASKHAALGIVRQLAHELAPVVRVNGVSPGATKTDIRMPAALGSDDKGEAKAANTQPQNTEDLIVSKTPLARWADPDEHVGAYVLLASRADGHLITGDVINSDTGLGVRGLVRTRGGDDLLARLGAARPR
jgi:NAD(P)-dependent dehydrogenase (short-subunit alcohol dehydrogenase family)